MPWHQDASYWAIEPKKTVTAWLALGETSPDNGCLRIIPGSHTRTSEHRAISDPTSWFDKGVDPRDIDESTAVDLALRPGEAVLFNEATLHGSEMNRSSQPRVAISFRYTSPEVRFLIDQWTDPGRVKTFLVRGEDRLHLNDDIRGVEPGEE
ncbi:MAG: phytanoyl-CoA dioxygenase family protein [Planctomycetes bacterium]|nr:phytanoyl-CoA dioxygenase family protein [Planctomycetota bacterium]